MLKLKVLTVLILVGFNSFSQSVIRDSVVVLTKKQAKAVAIDLVKYDALKEIAAFQDERINNFQQKEKLFGEQLSIKDTIIGKQSKLIDKQSAIISNSKKLQIHAYGGIQTNQFTLIHPLFRGNVMLEYIKLRAGVVYTVQPYNPSNWGVLIEYKLF